MLTKVRKYFVDAFILPLIGISVFLLLWTGVSKLTWDASQNRSDLPSPIRSWQDSAKYTKAPFTHNVEDNYDGIGLLTMHSLGLVAQGYVLAIAIGVPLGFLLGASKTFTKCFDPIFQVLRPVSPLAWYPLAGLVVVSLRKSHPSLDATTWQCILTIGICALWPTAVNTAVGVRAIPQDYHNIAKVLQLSRLKTFTKILFPAALPFMFTGFRLSLGIAWLVIVAAEMLSGKTGIGFFVNDAYSNADYGSMMMAIVVIGVVGFILDRMMSVLERNIHGMLAFISRSFSRILRLFERGEKKSPAFSTGSEVADAV